MTGLIFKNNNDVYIFIEQNSIIDVVKDGSDYYVTYGKAGCENRAILKKEDLKLRDWQEFIDL